MELHQHQKLQLHQQLDTDTNRKEFQKRQALALFAKRGPKGGPKGGTSKGELTPFDINRKKGGPKGEPKANQKGDRTPCDINREKGRPKGGQKAKPVVGLLVENCKLAGQRGTHLHLSRERGQKGDQKQNRWVIIYWLRFCMHRAWVASIPSLSPRHHPS